MNSQRACLAVVMVAVPLFLLGCSGGGDMLSATPGSPESLSSVRLAAADIQIAGHSVNNASIPAGAGPSSLFTVSLAQPSDQSRVAVMQMDYSSHDPMGMMGTHMSVSCYDDGTHGDAVAGDGTYSYLDMDEHIGPHYDSCASGAYTYTFHGTDMMGLGTNSIQCRVTVE